VPRLVVAVTAVTTLVAVLFVGGALWLRSRHGERQIREGLTRLAEDHIKGSVEVGTVRGSILGGIELGDVKIRDRRGHLVLSAAHVRLGYRAGSFLSRHVRFDRIELWQPKADVAALEDDRLDLSPLLQKLRELGKSATLNEVRLHQASLRRNGDVLDDVDASAWLDLSGGGRMGKVHVKKLRGRLALKDRPSRFVSLSGELRWKEGTTSVSQLRARLGQSFLAGEGQVSPKRIDVDVRELDVQAADFHALLAMEDPPAAINGTLSAHGPRNAVVTKIDLHPGKGHVHFDGVIDEKRRHITAVVDHQRLDGAFFPTQPPFVFNGRVRLDCRISDGGITGPVQIEGGASGSVANALVDHVTANGRFIGKGIDFAYAAGDLPGASATLRAHILFAGHIHLEFQAHVTDLGKLTSLLKGHIELPTTKGKSLVSLDGELNKQPKQKAKTTFHKVHLGKEVARRSDQSPL
jgi:hypothetical protein